MKTRMLMAMAGMLAGLTLPAAAQEKPPPIPAELPPLSAPAEPCDAPCEKPGLRVLWQEREIPLQRIVPREVITEQKTTTLEVAYREEKCVVTEVVFKPREVLKPVSRCVLRPVTETDPCTGKCCTVMKPVTEVQMVKDTEFVPVPEQRELVVRVPFLKEVEKVVPHRTVLLEWRNETRREGCPLVIPDVVPRERVLLAPKPCCP
jgi:hypothetical protein